MEPEWLPAAEDLPEGDMSIPFMEEPDMDMPDMDDDEEEDVAAGAAEPAEAGMTATADGIRMTAKTAPRAPRGFAEMNLAAIVGSAARSGTSGRDRQPDQRNDRPVVRVGAAEREHLP